MKQFIWTSAISVHAETLAEAVEKLAEIFPSDSCWHEFSDGVMVFAPGWEDPDDIYGLEDGPVCTCPPDLVARGGFKGNCLFHSNR